MKKLIKIDFDNTTRERKTEDSYSELYSYDKNNGAFEFEILNDTLTTEQVIALFKFTESNKIWKTTGTVEGNKVKVTFDTSLITQNETVICYLYFDEEQRTSDTFRFKFKVKVSEIDKMNRYEVKERFINNTVIVDRLDVVTKDELKEALKNVGGIATEGLLTEVKAEEIYAKKSEAVDNTNFELVKNRVLALELKTDKDTVYDDREVKERLTTLENKQPVDLSNYATKEELRNVSGSQPAVDNLVTKEELEAKHYISDVSNLATKEELQEIRNSQPTVDTSHLVTRDELESKGYLTTHQDLSEYAKKSELYNDSDLKARVEVLEQKTDKDTVYDDTPLKERVTALESKEDKDTKYDDTEVKRRLTELENKPAVDTSVFVTEEKLASKNYLTQHQPLDNLVTKEELNSKGYITDEVLNSKGYLTEHQQLTDYALKSELYNDTEVKERLTTLESRPNIDNSNFVTNEQLEAKHYLTEHQPLTHLATTSDLEVLRNISVNKAELSKKVDLTEYNSFKDNVVSKSELAEKGYLTEHQDISNLATKQEVEETYAKKSEIPQAYNDSALVSRINVLEAKTDNDRVYNDTEVKQRLTALENRQSTGEAVTSATSSEIRGTGMPNGVVEAPIGATYIDTAKTNGALKWIKTTDGGTTGWKVVEGDTGWITIFQGKVWRDFVNRLMIRRLNNIVNVVFEGLGDVEGIFFDKTAYPHNLDLVNVKVTDGFKPVSRITLPALNYASFYDEDGMFTIGTITFDVIDGMFKITLFSEQDRVGKMSNGLANINFNYATYEEWPTELPAQN